MFLIYQFYVHLSMVGVSHPLHLQTLFLNELGGNLELKFCKNIEDKFNMDMSCTHTHVDTHGDILILLSFMHMSKDHKCYWHLAGLKWYVVYFESSRCASVACKGISLREQHSRQQVQILVSDHFQHSFGFILNFRVYNHNFILFPWISQIFCCCCIELEYGTWCMVNLKAQFLCTSMKWVLRIFS